MSRLACGAALGATLLAIAAASGAWAQATGPATTFTDFLCEINLRDNGLEGSLTPAGRQIYPDGVISTFNSQKLCTGSATDQNVKITCTAQIPAGQWTGGNVVEQNVSCSIGGAACGIPGVFPAANSKLSISSTGLATLDCQYKGG